MRQPSWLLPAVAIGVVAVAAAHGTRATPAADDCLQWLECVGRTDAELLADLEPHYGGDGDCWSDGREARERCELACRAGLESVYVSDTADPLSDRRVCREPRHRKDTTFHEDRGGITKRELLGLREIRVEWDAQGVEIVLEHLPTTGFDFGIAETGSGESGWRREDCLTGTNRTQKCHILQGTRGRLSTVTAPTQVRSGSTTLFDAADAPNLTYVVTVDGGKCWVWGHDPAYYLDDQRFDSCKRL